MDLCWLICWRRNRLPTPVFLGFPGSSAGKESACNAGDLGSIPGLGRSPGEGNGYPRQYSGLENSMDYSPWGLRVRHDWVPFTHSIHIYHTPLPQVLLKPRWLISTKLGTNKASKTHNSCVICPARLESIWKWNIQKLNGLHENWPVTADLACCSNQPS